MRWTRNRSRRNYKDFYWAKEIEMLLIKKILLQISYDYDVHLTPIFSLRKKYFGYLVTGMFCRCLSRAIGFSPETESEWNLSSTPRRCRPHPLIVPLKNHFLVPKFTVVVFFVLLLLLLRNTLHQLEDEIMNRVDWILTMRSPYWFWSHAYCVCVGNSQYMQLHFFFLKMRFWV